jgi:hypothetical protein
MKSQFCSKCGVPLNVPAQPTSPSPPGQGKICPGCGFVNAYENSFYCKKCGMSLGKTDSGIKTENDRTRDAATRIKPSPVDVTKQRAAGVPAAGQSPPYREKITVLQMSRSGSYRKAGAVIAGIFLVIVIIGVVVVLGPGILPFLPANSTVPAPAGPSNPGPPITAAASASSPAIKATNTQVADASNAGTNPDSASPARSDATAPWPSEVSSTPAPVPPVSINSTPPWLSGDVNTTPPVMAGGNNDTPPWPTTTAYSTPPWLTGAK